MRLLRLAASKQQALAGRAARQREEELICYRTDGKAPLGEYGCGRGAAMPALAAALAPRRDDL